MSPRPDPPIRRPALTVVPARQGASDAAGRAEPSHDADSARSGRFWEDALEALRQHLEADADEDGSSAASANAKNESGKQLKRIYRSDTTTGGSMAQSAFSYVTYI